MACPLPDERGQDHPCPPAKPQRDPSGSNGAPEARTGARGVGPPRRRWAADDGLWGSGGLPQWE
eukprot:9499853-Pyramimonas_sp.AAC.3